MDETLSVQIKEAKVRSRASFFGKVTERIPYATQLTVTAKSGAWRKITTPTGKSGWVHASALIDKKIVLNAGKEDVEKMATTDELVLAGKGFSEKVEKAYRVKNPNLQFKLIDRMESFEISSIELSQFIQQGKLTNK